MNDKLPMNANKRYDKRIVIKWWKMVTLVRNPKLILERIEQNLRDKRSTKAAVVVNELFFTCHWYLLADQHVCLIFLSKSEFI